MTLLSDRGTFYELASCGAYDARNVNTISKTESFILKSHYLGFGYLRCKLEWGLGKNLTTTSKILPPTTN